MADQAKITSLDALETFRANLIVFVDKAHRSVDQVGDDVRRMKSWIEEQRLVWEREIRRRDRILGEAKQELLRARLSGLRDSTLVQEEAVRKAKRALEAAEAKLENVKRWTRDYDHRLAPLVKRMESLLHLLDYDMPKAIAYLVQAQRTLDAYAGTAAAPSTSLPAPPQNDSSHPNPPQP